MPTKSLLQTLRRAVLGLGLALTLVTAAIPARADNPPKFKDAEATAFYQKVSDIFDGILKAVKDKDDATLKQLNAEFDKIGAAGPAMDAKLTPDELTASNKWIAGQVQKLTAAGWTMPGGA